MRSSSSSLSAISSNSSSSENAAANPTPASSSSLVGALVRQAKSPGPGRTLRVAAWPGSASGDWPHQPAVGGARRRREPERRVVCRRRCRTRRRCLKSQRHDPAMAPARSVSPPISETEVSTMSRTKSIESVRGAVARGPSQSPPRRVGDGAAGLADSPGECPMRRYRRSPVAMVSRWATLARGATTIRAPATWARQQRSRSSPSRVMSGSKPRSVVKRSARTSVTPPGADEDVAL